MITVAPHSETTLCTSCREHPDHSSARSMDKRKVGASFVDKREMRALSAYMTCTLTVLLPPGR
jgi:ribosomal protein L44E